MRSCARVLCLAFATSPARYNPFIHCCIYSCPNRLEADSGQFNFYSCILVFLQRALNKGNFDHEKGFKYSCLLFRKHFLAPAGVFKLVSCKLGASKELALRGEAPKA